ncbi:MAG TPA: type 4a pilus biogenesis protein PilO [bacterium]|nr:type 4a pilus biogenesis protein PilO [bacterium]
MNRRDRLMLMIAIVLLGGIVFKFEIYDPQQAQYTTLVAARDAAADELARDERIVARAPQARAEYERARAHIAAVEQKLPQQKEIPALLAAMERFTKNVGVVFQSIRPGPLSAVALPPGAAQASPAGAQGQTRPGQHPPVYSSMPVELSLSGTFEQTVAYLRGLKNFPRLVIIDSVSLTPQVLPKLSVTIKAEIYTLGTPQAPAGGAR